MAKTEFESALKKHKKSKGKKRKHGVDHDEEVAPKTFIVETVCDDHDEQPKTLGISNLSVDSENIAEDSALIAAKKSQKRKSLNTVENSTKEKRRRTLNGELNDDGDDDNESIDDGAMEDDMPTTAEMHEAESIQNATAKETIRQKKKKKHEKRIDEQKSHNAEKDKQRNEEYLSKWKNTRDEWKFEKLRQISIQQSLFDESKITAAIWPIALEYLSGSKGAAKQKIIDLANEVIEALDKLCDAKTDEDERQLILDSAKYQRARDLLQSLD